MKLYACWNCEGPSVIDTSDTTCQRSFGKPLDFKHPHSLSQPSSFTESTSQHLSTFLNLHQPPTLSTNYKEERICQLLPFHFLWFFPLVFPTTNSLFPPTPTPFKSHPSIPGKQKETWLFSRLEQPPTDQHPQPSDPPCWYRVWSTPKSSWAWYTQNAWTAGSHKTGDADGCRFGCFGKIDERNGGWMKLEAVFCSSCLVLCFFSVLLRKNDMCSRSWGLVIRLVISWHHLGSLI